MVNSMGVQQRAAAERTILRLDAGGFVKHKPKGASYASYANRGAIRASGQQRHIIGHDLDFNPNAEGHPHCHHQSHPTRRDAWFDPRGRINDSVSCSRLTDTEMARLRVKVGVHQWALLTAKQAAEECLKAGIIPCFEAKFDYEVYADPQWWFDQFVKGWAPGLAPVIMSLPGTNGGRTGLDKLAAAHEVGLPTMWLWRGQPPAGYSKHVDLVKSRPHRGIYRVGA